MFTDDQIEEIGDFLDSVSPESKVYLGCDSVKYKKHGKWYGRYTVALVVHINNCNGCRIFGYNEIKPDYDQRANKPTVRLMNEASLIVECFQRMEEILMDREVEIHLDLNQDKKHASNAVLAQAAGYVKGVTLIDPKAKPEAFCASYAADHLVRR